MPKSNYYFPSDYEEFIYKSRYARWDDEKGRREDWPETVSRYMNFMLDRVKNRNGVTLDESTQYMLERAILDFEVMPSMRALMTAGPALERDNTAGYNCSYLPIDHPYAFDEAMYILMCGTGVGFSCEKKYVRKLPAIPVDLDETTGATIVVEDSKEGWALSLRELIEYLYDGVIPSWDTSKVRGAGERLKTFGGRASGPKPLVELFTFVVDTFRAAAGRKLTDIEAHDIMCKIGEVVVVGGVRRSAMISLSDLSSSAMAKAKSGEWWKKNPQRALANNSVAYETKPNAETFLREWTSLVESKSGERGVFNREASVKQAAKNGRRDTNYEYGTNPCSEIILRPYQFCNLTSVVARAEDSLEVLKEKVRIAAILGTIQSTLTDFPYLREEWKKNTEEERLLGVSITGIMDNPILNGTSKEYGMKIEHILEELRQVAVDTNKEFAALLNIPQSVAVSCIKPEGTVSQLVDAASGIHDRHNPHYIRTVRGDNKDPLTQFLKDSGIPSEPDVTKPDSTTVFSFPRKSPEGAITRSQKSAVEQLELWLLYQRHWCEHKPSVTVSVKEHEWLEVGAWVYNHFDEISGVSFLPFSEHTYAQAPYQDIDEETYLEKLNEMPPKLDWSVLSLYEKEDNTTGTQTLNCTGSVCEVVDIGTT